MCYFDMCVFDCFVDTVLGPKAWSWCALYIATLNLLQSVESAKIVVSEDCPRKTSFVIYSHFPIILIISMKPAGLIAVSMRQSGIIWESHIQTLATKRLPITTTWATRPYQSYIHLDILQYCVEWKGGFFSKIP